MDYRDFSPTPEGPVIILGAAGVDLVGRLKKDLLPGTSNPAKIRASFGGVARNVAENLARLGQPVCLLTAVGTDEVGEQLLQQAARAGVDVGSVLRTSEYPSGAYLAVVNSNGVLQFALDDMRAMNVLTPAYLHAHAPLFKQASLLFVDANLPKETLRAAIALARQARLPICADPTSISLASRLKPYLSRLYLITPNHAEAEVLCNRPISALDVNEAIEAAKCLVSHGVGMTIITLAQFGVCYATSETSGHVPAIRTEIIDPTGAGDALTAAVIFALLNQIPLDDAIRLGVSAASLTLRYPGSVLPDLTLEKLYSQLVI
jgi:pseudouridine kinase